MASSQFSKPFGMLEVVVSLMGASVVLSFVLSLLNTPRHSETTALETSLNEFRQKTHRKDNSITHSMDEIAPHGREQLMDTAGGLVCDNHGGPTSAEASNEMVYWQDIPSDADYVGPFYHSHGHHSDENPRYLTFEPDGGGWNNIRMAMETVIGLGIATGRTIVLPPDQRMYLLAKNRGKVKTDFSFADFFPLEKVEEEHPALNFMSTQEFLEKEAMTGHMVDTYTGRVTFPPFNRTDWDGQDVKPLKFWLQNSTVAPRWSPGACMAAFPSSSEHEDVDQLRNALEQIKREGNLKNTTLETPTPVDASVHDRLYENLSKRKHLCLYNEEMQLARVVHFMCNHKLRVRMLVHFYAFLFFQDWRDDLWMKRFMRDHLRYTDEIQCAAARVVEALRGLSREKGQHGEFATLHVRRGDFQFKQTRIEAPEILANVKDQLVPGEVIFIATDEKNKSFFDVFKKEYTVKFLNDYMHLLDGINTNYYGMIDQLIASRGRVFFGCWHSTFSGFIFRMRGYVADRDKLPGYEKGILPTSYYYATIGNKFAMHKYAPLHGAFFNREFPTSWRNIDKSVGDLPQSYSGTSQQDSRQ